MSTNQSHAPKNSSLFLTMDQLTGLVYKVSSDDGSLLPAQDSLNSDSFNTVSFSAGNNQTVTGVVETSSSLLTKITSVISKGEKPLDNAIQNLSLSATQSPVAVKTTASNDQSFTSSVTGQFQDVINSVRASSSSTIAASSNLGTNGGDLTSLSKQLAPYFSGRLIVKFKKGINTIQSEQIKKELGVVSTKTIGLTGAQIWKFSGISVESALAKYGASALFEYIEPDYIVTAGALTPKATTPNDPSFSSLWGLNNTGQSGGTLDADIDAPEAWDIQKGNPNLVIGVIDTGVDYNHQDLVGNIWTNSGEIAGDGIDNDGNGYIDDVRGWDFAFGDNDPMDVDGHGTHVSGTIAGKGNNGVGVTGVAWNAKIMPLRFLDDTGSGSTSDAILAISYATAMGVKITNNSWGGGGFSQALFDAINTAGQQGALFIAAAGNDGMNNDVSPSYPASYNLANIISVASTTRTDSLSSFSNFGLTSVDLGAPGSDILSTTPGNTYSTFSGTSMATPHVSGAAALLWSQNPTWTAQQVKNTLMNTGDSIAALAGKTVSGKRLNVYNALVASSLPSVTIGVSPASVQEDGATNLVYTFTRSSLGLSSPLTVNFGVNGTANAALVGSDPADYSVLTGSNVTFNPTTKTGTVTFAANVNIVQVVVDPIADALAEITSETAVLTVSSGTGYIGGSPNSATGTIISEEALPIFSNTSPITIPDFGAGNPYPSTINVSGLSGNLATLKVTLTNLSHTFPDDIDILLVGPNGAKAILMSDVGGLNGLSNVTLTFDSLATTALPDSGLITSGTYLPTDFNIGDLFNSPAPVGPYGTDFSVFNNTNPNGVWSLYIMDDLIGDSGAIAGGWSLNIGTASTAPTLAIAATNANQAEGNSGTKAFTFTVTRSGTTTVANDVNWAVTGSGTNPANATDFVGGVLPTGTVSFAAGETSKIVTVNVQGDTTVEPDENFTVTLSAPTNGATITTATAIGTIQNDDGVTTPSITLASNYSGVSENGKTNLVYTFNRTGDTTSPLTVNFGVSGSAINGNDYVAYGGALTSTQGTVTFAVGATTAQLALVTSGDTVKESNETIDLTLTSGTGYQIGTPTVVTTTILNDDGVLNQQGTTGNDVIEAGSTSTLSGKAGDDSLIGSSASNILVGGAGNDTLTTGTGFDTVLFTTKTEGIDTITDFNVYQDLIQVSAVNFGGGLIAGESISSDQFSISLGSVTANTRFIFDKPTGNLFFDIDGSGSNSSVQFASLTANLGLTEDNIFVA